MPKFRPALFVWRVWPFLFVDWVYYHGHDSRFYKLLIARYTLTKCCASFSHINLLCKMVQLICRETWYFYSSLRVDTWEELYNPCRACARMHTFTHTHVHACTPTTHMHCLPLSLPLFLAHARTHAHTLSYCFAVSFSHAHPPAHTLTHPHALSHNKMALHRNTSAPTV